MSKSLSEWDATDRRDLWAIEDGSRIAKEAAMRLSARPTWVTKAEVELDEAIRILTEGLEHLRQARKNYVGKAVE